jgi:hypothetical protein
MPVVHPIRVTPSGTTAADTPPADEPARRRSASQENGGPACGRMPVATKYLDAHHGSMQPPGATRRPGRVLAVTVLLLGLCSLVSGCGLGSAASTLPSPSPIVSPAGGPPSVTGIITAGPVCPVEQSPPDPKCAPRPVAGAVIVATDASGQEVGRATSAADGSYELIVAETGQVLVTALPVEGLAGAPAPVPLTFTSPGEVRHLDLEYDTGIR